MLSVEISEKVQCGRCLKIGQFYKVELLQKIIEPKESFTYCEGCENPLICETMKICTSQLRVRVTDSKKEYIKSLGYEESDKALRYNTNKLQWSLVHFKSLEPMIEVLMYGKHKYSIFEDENGTQIKGADLPPIYDVSKYKLISSGADNWKKGLDKKEILESSMRHLTALMDGETHDPESGLHHIGHLMCNNMFYSYFENKEQEEIINPQTKTNE